MWTEAIYVVDKDGMFSFQGSPALPWGLFTIYIGHQETQSSERFAKICEQM